MGLKNEVRKRENYKVYVYEYVHRKNFLAFNPHS